MRSFFSKGALFGAVVAGFMIPFTGVGSFSIHDVTGIMPFDLTAAVFLPFFIGSLAQSKKQLFLEPVSISLFLLCASLLISGACSQNPVSEWKSILRASVQWVFILGAAAVGADPDRREHIYFGFLFGGFISLSVSIIGYAAYLLTLGRESGALPFVFVGPLFGMEQIPRLSGTLGHSPEHFGETAVALLAVSFAAQQKESASLIRRGFLLAVRILAPVAILLTISYAAVGGLAVISGWIWMRFFRSKKAALVLLAINLSAISALSFYINLGPATQLGTEVSLGIDPENLDKEHTFYVLKDDTDRLFPEYRAGPYPRLTTVYLHAKMTAMEIAVEHFPFGTGYEQYPLVVKEKIARKYNAVWSNTYGYPHCQYLISVAVGGVVGAIALIVFVFAVGRIFFDKAHLESVEIRALVLCLAGFLAIGINVDIMESRSLWLVTALMLGSQMNRSHCPSRI